MSTHSENSEHSEQSGHTLTVPGATLYYRLQGAGPPLLVLQAGDGDADATRGLVAHLADHYTVITYDRRGLSRSVLDDPDAEYGLSDHTDDVHRLLRAVTSGAAHLVGFSFGGFIGLDLLTRHPEQIGTLIAHEPPVVQVLPAAERDELKRILADVATLFEQQGPAVAMARFQDFAGMRFDESEPDAPRPDPSQGDENTPIFLGGHAPQAHRHVLGMDAIVAEREKVVPACSTTSPDGMGHQCAIALARALGRPAVDFPGSHAGFLTHPRATAARICEILAQRGTLVS